jgi:hypothetical protein
MGNCLSDDTVDRRQSSIKEKKRP